MANGVEIITIGTELLLGTSVDGNGAWLGRFLAESGIAVRRRTTIGDDLEGIRSAVSDALGRTGAAICTGGLGPTRDDVTRIAVARLFRRELVLHEEWLEVIRRRFQERNIEMPAVNRVQAEIPAGATLFPNARGTAPGIAVGEAGLGVVVLLPGVPHEMQGLMRDHVLAYLLERGLSNGVAITSRTVRTTGIAESALAERIDDVVEDLAPLTVAFLPTGVGEDVRITSWGELPAAQADQALNRAEALLVERLGRYVYGTGDDDLAAAVAKELRARGLTLAIAESCTGGIIAKRMTDLPGSSEYLLAGIVAYANDAKRDLLGVRASTLEAHGAVSEQTAIEMAAGARAVTGASCGLSVTGIAGPAGGSPDKPVGTIWIGIAVGDDVGARRFRFHGARGEIRDRAAQAALADFRHALLKPSD